MKLAFFADTRHPNAAYWMADLADEFDVEVHAIDFSAPDLPSSRIVQHVLRTPARGKLRYPMCILPLRKLLKRIRPDILLGYRVVSYGFAAAAVGDEYPLVLAAQGPQIVYPEFWETETKRRRSPFGSRWCARYSLRRADLIHAWADHMAAAMLQLGAEPSTILVLHRGVRTDVFHPPEPGPRSPRIVTSRQLRPSYRTALIIRALGELRGRGVPVELVICGDGPARLQLESLVRELKLGDAVTFRGRLQVEALAETYRSATVYASMVPTDGLSSSLLEAMSTGLIPVVADHEANRPWVHDGVGRLVPGRDVATLTQALGDALELARKDPSAGAKNRQIVVSRADRRTNLARMVSYWTELIERRKRRERG